MDTPIGDVNVLSTELLPKDKVRNLIVRAGIGRDSYGIPPGVYAIGNPNEDSNVFVTANYKVTVDRVRCELDGIDAWLLVLDTKGVNVWCAAAKGAFSTEEIIYRVKKLRIRKLVNHNTLILPQFSGPGVSAHRIKTYTGFKAVYGPLYAKDIKEYLDNDSVVAEEMREVEFDTRERVEVSLVEAKYGLRYMPLIFLIFLALQLIGGGKVFSQAAVGALLNTIAYALTMIVGSLVYSLLFSLLPSKLFSLKAGFLGILWSLVVIALSDVFAFDRTMFNYLGNSLVMTAIICFMGLNYTGCSTFTSLSGVDKETKIATPIIGTLFIVGVALLVIGSFV